MREPKQIGSSTVGELIFIDDGAGATMIPALFFPTLVSQASLVDSGAG